MLGGKVRGLKERIATRFPEAVVIRLRTHGDAGKTAELFRRRILDRAGDAVSQSGPRLRESSGLQHVLLQGEAKVNQLRFPHVLVTADHDVRRLDVAVNDAL